MTETDNRASDLLYGARAIAGYLGVSQKQVYHLIETKRIPAFKVGKVVCSRRSTMDAALDHLEAASADSD
jgi:excisionase family DNA binding protein